jgi:hypothetical protein
MRGRWHQATGGWEEAGGCAGRIAQDSVDAHRRTLELVRRMLGTSALVWPETCSRVLPRDDVPHPRRRDRRPTGARCEAVAASVQ